MGSALTTSLNQQGFDVKQLVRGEPGSTQQIRWNPAASEVPLAEIEEADIVINLAGASIAGGWWTQNRKKQIMESRVQSTSTLANAIASVTKKPSLFISTSAVGYYGDRPGEVLDESADQGEMFLSDVCEAWERSANPALDAGVRVVHPRFGVVLSGKGGMLPLMSLPFKLLLGGKIGGNQHMAWIDLKDLVRIFLHIIATENLHGPVNAVAPESPTNAEFTKAMSQAIGRPAVIPVPAKVAGVVGGELARELLLPDQNVIPRVLQESGFTFEYPTIQSSLNNALG